MFEREARLSSNPGRSRLSPCPMVPSASDWALCLLQLLSEKLRWNRCLFMGDRDDFFFAPQTLILPPPPLKNLTTNYTSCGVVTVSKDKTPFVLSRGAFNNK